VNRVKAVILKSAFHLGIQEIPQPVPGPDEVLIRVKACGICGSDIRYYQGHNPWAQHTLGCDKENPPNMALGHEIAGVIESCPVNHPRLRPGMRVSVLAFKGCGVCQHCLAGRENLCADTQHLGHSAGWDSDRINPGGMADYIVAWEDKVYEIPDNVSFAEAVLLDGAAVALHAVKRGGVRPGNHVLVCGTGPIGLLALQVAKARGAAHVTCVDIIENRLSLARQLGADATVLARPGQDLGAAFKAVLPRPADVILDSVGDPGSFPGLMDSLARGGTLVLLAVKGAVVQLNQLQLSGERTVTVSANNMYEDFPEAIELAAAGKLNLKPMVTHTLPLEQVADGFKLMMDEATRDSAVKVVVEP
jgi:2-desacetyl-2-hydroxyethyl bacteriochlorophyllide A dehydrogenase